MALFCAALPIARLHAISEYIADLSADRKTEQREGRRRGSRITVESASRNRSPLAGCTPFPPLARRFRAPSSVWTAAVSKSLRYAASRHPSLSSPAARWAGLLVADRSVTFCVATYSTLENSDADQLAIDMVRRNDEGRQPPGTNERSPARRAGIDARAARRRSRPASRRVGAPACPPRRAAVVRGTDEGTRSDALLRLQETAS